jgi:3-hydroxyisobutyrate dehydrogenase-like beta-hydroxyacid dehydrogenase
VFSFQAVPMEHIGIIGLGAMGGAMATRLLAAGFRVGAWSRNPDKTHHLQAQGLLLHASQQSLFSNCTVLLTNVTTTSDVRGLLLGPCAAERYLAPGSLVIDFSTIDAGVTQEIALALRQHRIAFLDAPVSGGQSRAETGELSIMVGGDATDVERARPVLQVLGKTITHTGGNGSAQVVKAANQMVMCSTLVGIAEAAAYARHFGADLHTMVKVLSAGLAGSEVLKWAGPKMADHDFSRTIAARLHEKDLRMVSETLLREGLSMPVTQAVSKRLTQLIEAGMGDGDTSAVLRIVEEHLKDPS